MIKCTMGILLSQNMSRGFIMLNEQQYCGFVLSSDTFLKFNMYLSLSFFFQSYFPKLHDVGICVVNLVDDSQEYTRGLFFLM